MPETKTPEIFTTPEGDQYQLVPITITMAVALPVEWPKPETLYDCQGPLARAVYDDLVDKLLDLVPSWNKKWTGEGEDKFTSYSQRYDGEVQSVDIDMGDDCDWGFAGRDLDEALRRPGVYLGLGAQGLSLTAESRGEHEGRQPVVPSEALEEWKANRARVRIRRLS